ncbi:MAG: hypothetical protein H0V47_14620, partial [Chloroflexia bacterium]|nr:hypothetical protein [Chloroflexia bacterium]
MDLHNRRQRIAGAHVAAVGIDLGGEAVDGVAEAADALFDLGVVGQG